jgi:H/ACA ribonucleoprotein complex subunit 3
MRVKPVLRKCPDCNTYTLKIECGKCSSETRIPKPARYSPEDKYGEYRRKLKKMVAGDISAK